VAKIIVRRGDQLRKRVLRRVRSSGKGGWNERNVKEIRAEATIELWQTHWMLMSAAGFISLNLATAHSVLSFTRQEKRGCCTLENSSGHKWLTLIESYSRSMAIQGRWRCVRT